MTTVLTLSFDDRMYNYTLPQPMEKWSEFQVDFGQMLTKFLKGDLGKKRPQRATGVTLKSLPADRKQGIRQAITNGKSLSQVAHDFGISTSVAKKVMLENDANWKNPNARNKISPEKMAEIVAAIKNRTDETVSSVCDRLHISTAQWYKIQSSIKEEPTHEATEEKKTEL